MTIHLHVIFSEQLRRLRRAQEWTQGELAERCGWRGKAGCKRIAQYEQGRRLPSLPDAVVLAEAMGVSIDRLVGRAL